MRKLVALMCAGVVLGAAAGGVDAAQGRGKRRSAEPSDQAVTTSAAGKSMQVSIVFSPHDVTLIRRYYETRSRNLPPGLQKKIARGGSLPPGWQKKMEPFPASLERELIVLGSGHRYGVYDGHAVIYHPLTHAIMDIISLF
jgi:hypothetical protein